jgi:DNA polymerase-4
VSPPILHVDVDAFFVAVEVRDDPGLAGLPLAVADQVVACASYEARAWGVHAGMTVGQAVRACPRLVTVRLRPGAYERASADLFTLLHEVAEAVEAGSVEEAFVRLPGLGWPDVDGAAAGLRDRIRDGVGLPVSIGAGRTKLMAKLASRAAKPGGIVVTTPDAEPAVRDALRVDELWGVGPTTHARLADAGVVTVADLRTWSVDALAAVAGTAMGRRLYRIAAGTDDTELAPPPPRRSFSVQRSAPAPVADLAGTLAGRLRAAHLACHTLHMRQNGERARARFDPPTNDPDVLAAAVLRLAGRPITGAQLTVTDLVPQDRPAQPPLPGL